MAKKMPVNYSIELKHHMEVLAKKGAVVIFLNTADLADSYGKASKPCCEVGTDWLEKVEVHKRKSKKSWRTKCKTTFLLLNRIISNTHQ